MVDCSDGFFANLDGKYVKDVRATESYKGNGGLKKRIVGLPKVSTVRN